MPNYTAVCCDLLTALVDSWTLWERVAENAEAGTRWRLESLRLVTAAHRYRPYERVVEEAAHNVGLDPELARPLLEGWAALEPYPDVRPALLRLGLPVVIVTNTSQALAETAAARLQLELLAVVSAEASGWYKPEPDAYRAGWVAAGASRPLECLFVAGSPHDVAGAAAAGHDVFWVNRRAAVRPAGARAPRWEERTLDLLPQVAGR